MNLLKSFLVAVAILAGLLLIVLYPPLLLIVIGITTWLMVHNIMYS